MFNKLKNKENNKNSQEVIVSKNSKVEKVIQFILCIILFLVPLWKLPNNEIDLSKYIVLLICGAFLIVCLFLKRKELKFDLIDKTLIAFFILIVLSTIFSINIKKSIIGETSRYEGLLTFIIYFLIYYCAKYYFKNNKYLKGLAIATTVIASIIGICQYYNIFPNIIQAFYKNSPGSAISTFGHRNFFGSFLAVVVPLFMALYLTKKKKIYLVVSFISFWAMLVCMTRSAWVGLAVASVVGLIYIIKNFNKGILIRTIQIAVIFIITFIFVLFPPSFVNKSVNSNSKLYGLQNRIKSVGTDIKNMFGDSTQEEKMSIGTARMGIWIATLNSIAQDPLLGTGPDTLKDGLFKNSIGYVIYRYETYHESVDKAHNEYLHIGATIGIPAMIIYLAFLAQIVLGQKNTFKNEPTFILMVAIISYLAQAFFNISTLGIAPIFWALLGLVQNEKFKEKM